MNESLSFWKSFFGVFIHPRKVIRNIIDNDTHYFVWPFILLYSILATMSPELYIPLLRKTAPSVLFPVGAGITFLSMVALFWAFTAFAYFAGKVMGGTGKFEEVLVAYMWCLPPAFIGMLLDLLSATPTWFQIFSGTTDPHVLTGPKMAWQYLLVFVYYVLLIWSLVLDVIAIAEAHRFAAWKSLVIGLIAFFAALFIGLSIGIFLAVMGMH